MPPREVLCNTGALAANGTMCCWYALPGESHPSGSQGRTRRYDGTIVSPLDGELGNDSDEASPYGFHTQKEVTRTV